MINFTSRTKYFISSKPTDMRNGREGLAGIVREVMGHNPKCYDEAFIFYSKDYLKPEFAKILNCHEISRETLILLLSTAIQTKIAI